MCCNYLDIYWVTLLGGMVEWWNGERRNGDMVERRNGEMVERQ